MSLVFNIDDRLIEQFEFTVDQSITQICFQFAAQLHDDIHGRFKEPVGAASVSFGSIESRIRTLNQLSRRGAIYRRSSYPDTHIHICPQTAEIVWRFERRSDSICQHRYIRLICRILNNRKLVAAQARHGIVVPDALLQPLGHHLQQFVADQVS